MPISTLQYRDIMYEYDQRRMRNQQLLEERTEAVCQEIPELDEIQNQLIHLSIRQAQREVSDPEEASRTAGDYKAALAALRQRKVQLLTEHGYPEDYLSPIYTCPDCQDTGYIGSNPCQCLQRAKSELLYQDSNLKEILQSENFQTFQEEYYDDTRIVDNLSLTPRQNILKVRKECQDYIANFDQEYENLIFYGPTGVGKTFLTHCIAKELLDAGHSVVYLTSLQLFAILEKNKFGQAEAAAESSEQISHLIHCDLLIIDDLGTELTNSFTTSQLYYFIEERHLQKRSTIFSTNISFHDLRERYGERIFSRFIGYYHFCQIAGRDIRPLKRLT